MRRSDRRPRFGNGRSSYEVQRKPPARCPVQRQPLRALIRPWAVSALLTVPTQLSIWSEAAWASADVQDLKPAPGLRAVCVAAAPTVQNPVALDWSADGHLWVAEGVLGTGPTLVSGRVVRCSDANGDGVFDRRTAFLEGLPPVSSVMDWPPGLLIAAAPDLIYAEDSDGDGAADLGRRLFIGFGAESATRRFNSMTFGLDGWVYAASGLGGGRVQPLVTSQPGAPSPEELIDLGDADFRLSPDQGRIEPVAGLSWGGRTRDEYGFWLGVDQDYGLVQFPLARHYALRNPAGRYPDPVVGVCDLQDRQVNLADATDPTLLESEREILPPGGNDFYRAHSFGPLQQGDLLVAVPNAHRVLRVPLRLRGVGFAAVGPAEVLLSASPQGGEATFTPTQVRTGPDDAVWITDARSMLVEAEESVGRIVRLERVDEISTRLEDRLTLLQTDPVQALAVPNGTLRDLAHRRICAEKTVTNATLLRSLAAGSGIRVGTESRDDNPGPVRTQALSIMQQIGLLSTADLENALAANEPALRAHALRLSEPILQQGIWFNAIDQLIDDPDPGVRFQAALALGEATHPEAARRWVRMALTWSQDSWMRAALVSGATAQPLRLLQEWLNPDSKAIGSDAAVDLTRALIHAARVKYAPGLIAALLSDYESNIALVGIAELIQIEFGVDRRGADGQEWLSRLVSGIHRARTTIAAGQCSASELPFYLSVLGVQPQHWTEDRRILLAHAQSGSTSPVRETALATLLRSSDPNVARVLLEAWPRWRPSLRPAIISALLTHEPWIEPLMKALDDGVLSASELSPAQQDQLLHHPDPGVRSTAGKLMEGLLPPPRTTILESFQQAFTAVGDARRGRKLFEDRCTICHAPTPPLLPIGPDLSSIGSRTLSELAQAILDPNALVEPSHRAFFIDTQDDEAFTGILRGETDEVLELLEVGGTTLIVPLVNTKSIRASNLSLMPEGLEAGLSPQDLANLLAYLKALR